MAGVEGENEES